RASAPARPAARRSRSRGAPRRAAKVATGAVGDAVGGRGNIFMQLLGWTLALSLIYLLVAGKGVSALGGIVTAITGGVRAFITPVDPIKSLEGALGASPVSSSSSASSASGATEAPAAPAGLF